MTWGGGFSVCITFLIQMEPCLSFSLPSQIQGFYFVFLHHLWHRDGHGKQCVNNKPHIQLWTLIISLAWFPPLTTSSFSSIERLRKHPWSCATGNSLFSWLPDYILFLFLFFSALRPSPPHLPLSLTLHANLIQDLEVEKYLLLGYWNGMPCRESL